MNRWKKGTRGSAHWLSGGALVLGLWTSNACTGNANDAPEPSGGADAVGGRSDPAGGRTSDGGRPAGGGGAGGEGPLPTGGALPICDDHLGAGGAIYLNNCPTWLGERDGSLGFGEGSDSALNVNCGGEGGQSAGGEGGESSGGFSKLPLRTLCESHDKMDLNSVAPVARCLEEVALDACNPGHAKSVQDCLYLDHPCVDAGPDCLCVFQNHGCAEMRSACPDLDGNLCFWGMSVMADLQAEDEARGCFAAPKAGESCDETFQRCVWGL